MPAPEMTQTLKNDLQVLRMRGALEGYKSNDLETLPKYFQVSCL